MVTRRLRLALLASLMTAVAHAPVTAQLLPVDSIKPYLSRGNYVFEAVLQKTGAVADSLLPVTEMTAIAKVSIVFACPREVGNFAGDVITLSEPLPHAPIGARSWYLATGWAIGDHVAVNVLRRVDGINSTNARQFFDSLRAAVHLSYEDAVQAAAQASDVIAIATFGTTQNVMMDLAPPHTERPERWARLNVTLDSIRGNVPKVVKDSAGKDTTVFLPGWSPVPDSTRKTGMLIPYELAYDVLGKPVYTAGARRLLFFQNLSDRPNVQRLDASAAGFIAKADGIRPLSDAALLGSTLAVPTFSLAPVQECVQKVR